MTSQSKGMLLWRSLNGLMAIFFVTATFLQLNDPDPAIWMYVYGIASVISFSILTFPQLQEQSLWKGFVLIHCAACLAMIFYVILYYGEIIKTDINILHNAERARTVWFSHC
ncbi:transmembrane protein 220-like isoform X2 [Hydractinia symbiolongicarpus]|nr:transmembrane protein 220-like isoform X2 [Hydractinia symbiolongicarpus]